MISCNAMLQRYYRTIYGYLPCSSKQKKRILNEIRSNVNRYLEEFPNADFSQIEAHFGNPQNIAAAYVDDMNTQELLYSLRVRKKLVISVIAGIITMLIMWGTTVTAAYINSQINSSGYMDSFIVDLSTEPTND